MTGQSFREWTHENIFEPLGMTNTHFQDNHQEIVENKAYGYAGTNDGFAQTANGLTALASSSLFTTIDDLVKWVLNFDEPVVGNAAVMKMMHTQGILNDGEEIAYAFGNSITEYQGLKRVAHSGSWAGFRTYLARFPDHNFAVITLSNASTTNAGGTAMEVADVFLLDHFSEPADQESELSTRELATEPIPTSLLEAIPGTYVIDEGPQVEVLREGDELFVQVEGQPKFQLTLLGGQRFKAIVPNVNAELSFETEADGSVQTGTIHQNGDAPIRRVEPWAPTPQYLQQLAGRYYSQELETAYTLKVEDGPVQAELFRNAQFERDSPARVL